MGKPLGLLQRPDWSGRVLASNAIAISVFLGALAASSPS
jgi:hypothetical protein